MNPEISTEQLLAQTAWLTRVARALARNDDDAEEIAQQSWLHAFERPPSHAANLRSWFSALARNLVRSRERSKERESRRLRALPGPPSTSSPAEAVARAELQQVVLDAVLSLAEPYRSTLVSRFLDERSAEEIACESEEPVETVRTRIKRGLEQVRARVAKKLGSDEERLPALLTPLFGSGVVVMSSAAKIGTFVAVASALLAVTIVVTRSRSDGGAREDRRTAAEPAAAAASDATASPAVVAVPVREVDPVRTSVNANAPSWTFDVVGSVVDSNGEHVPDSFVFVCERDDAWESRLDARLFWMARRAEGSTRTRLGEAHFTAKTDAEGRFEIAGISRARPYQIAAAHANRGFGKLIDLEPPADSETKEILINLVPGLEIHGRVVDAAGEPVSKPHLSVYFEGYGGTGTNEYNVGESEFAIPAIPIDEIVISASDESGMHRSIPLTLRAAEGGAAQEVTLRLEVAPVAIRFHGRVLAPDGEPLTSSHPFFVSLVSARGFSKRVSPVKVWAFHGDPPEIGSGFQVGVFGDSQFDPKLGEYTCVAPLDEDFKLDSLVVFVCDQVLAVLPLDESMLVPTEDVREVPDLVVAAPDAPPPPIHAELKVQIRDGETGDSLAPAATIKFLQRTDEGASSGSVSEGRWSGSQKVLPGRCSIVAECPGYVADWTSGDFEARAEPYVVLIALRRAVRVIRGRVHDSDDRPIDGARLHWLAEADQEFRTTAVEPVTTDSAGRFEFSAVGAGRGRIAVEAEDFVPAFADVDSGNSDASVAVELARGVTVTFTGPESGGRQDALRILANDGSIVRDDWNAYFERTKSRWPCRLTLAPGEYRYHVTFTARAHAGGSFTASEGAEIIVMPQTR